MSYSYSPSAPGHPVHPQTAAFLHTPIQNIPEAYAGWSDPTLNIQITREKMSQRHVFIHRCNQAKRRQDTGTYVFSTDPEGRGV